MTTQPLALDLPGTDSQEPVAGQRVEPVRVPVPRAGSRLQRAKMPSAKKVATDAAVEFGVCIRPIPLRKLDVDTGETSIVDSPCGATLTAVCPPCADRARRLRAQQCREGWHLDTEPDLTPDPSTEQQRQLVTDRADITQVLHDAELDGDELLAQAAAESLAAVD